MSIKSSSTATVAVYLPATFGYSPWTVQRLVNNLASGHLRLRDIHRPFVRSNAKVR